MNRELDVVVDIVRRNFTREFAVVGETSTRALAEGRLPDDARGGHEFGTSEAIAVIAAAIALVREVLQLARDLKKSANKEASRPTLIIERLKMSESRLITDHPEIHRRIDKIVADVLKMK